jgi:hypothetical protein
MVPFLYAVESRVRLLIVFGLELLKVGDEVVKRAVLIAVYFLPELLKFLLRMLLVNLCPFLTILFCKFCEVFVHSTLKFLDQIRMTLFRVHGSLLELSHHMFSDFLFL